MKVPELVALLGALPVDVEIGFQSHDGDGYGWLVAYRANRAGSYRYATIDADGPEVEQGDGRTERVLSPRERFHHRMGVAWAQDVAVTRGPTFDEFVDLVDVIADEVAARVDPVSVDRLRHGIEAALVAASPPLGFELRPDGNEDRESAAYVQGAGEVVAAVRRALRDPGDRQAPARPE